MCVFDEGAFNRQLGAKIAAMRRRLAWSQRRLAEVAGLSAAAVCNYERGQKTPGLGRLQAIADALGVTATSLLPK